MEDGLVCLFSGSIVLVPSVSSLEGAAVRNQMPRRMEKPSSKLLPEEGKSQWVKCWKCGAWIHCRKCLTHHLYNTPHSDERKIVAIVPLRESGLRAQSPRLLAVQPALGSWDRVGAVGSPSMIQGSHFTRVTSRYFRRVVRGILGRRSLGLLLSQ